MKNILKLVWMWLRFASDKLQTLWGDLSLHIYRETTQRVGFNVSNFILGDLPLSNNNRVINLIILYVKQYIFISLMQNKMPNFLGLLSHLRIKYRIEKYAAIQNQTLLNLLNCGLHRKIFRWVYNIMLITIRIFICSLLLLLFFCFLVLCFFGSKETIYH